MISGTQPVHADRFLYGPRGLGGGAISSIFATTSSSDQSRSLTFADIAGLARSDLWTAEVVEHEVERNRVNVVFELL